MGSVILHIARMVLLLCVYSENETLFLSEMMSSQWCISGKRVIERNVILCIIGGGGLKSTFLPLDKYFGIRWGRVWVDLRELNVLWTLPFLYQRKREVILNVLLGSL